MSTSTSLALALCVSVVLGAATAIPTTLQGALPQVSNSLNTMLYQRGSADLPMSDSRRVLSSWEYECHGFPRPAPGGESPIHAALLYGAKQGPQDGCQACLYDQAASAWSQQLMMSSASPQQADCLALLRYIECNIQHSASANAVEQGSVRPVRQQAHASSPSYACMILMPQQQSARYQDTM